MSFVSCLWGWFVCVCVCLGVCVFGLSVCLSVFGLSGCLSVCLWLVVCVSVCLSVLAFLFVWVSVRVCVYVCLSMSERERVKERKKCERFKRFREMTRER